MAAGTEIVEALDAVVLAVDEAAGVDDDVVLLSSLDPQAARPVAVTAMVERMAANRKYVFMDCVLYHTTVERPLWETGERRRAEKWGHALHIGSPPG
jgi:hypothetical protein